jgi:hypothetical protein
MIRQEANCPPNRGRVISDNPRPSVASLELNLNPPVDDRESITEATARAATAGCASNVESTSEKIIRD